MNSQQLMVTAQALVGGDKGLLAMDESNPTCNKRFAPLGIPQTEAAPPSVPRIDCHVSRPGRVNQWRHPF